MVLIILFALSFLSILALAVSPFEKLVKMQLLTVLNIVMMFLFALAVVTNCEEPLPWLIQIIMALPVTIVSSLSVWWLSLGGQWRL